MPGLPGGRFSFCPSFVSSKAGRSLTLPAPVPRLDSLTQPRGYSRLSGELVARYSEGWLVPKAFAQETRRVAHRCSAAGDGGPVHGGLRLRAVFGLSGVAPPRHSPEMGSR